MKLRLRNNASAIALFVIVILAVTIPIAMQNSYETKAIYGDDETRAWDYHRTLVLSEEVPFATHYVARGITFSYIKIAATAPVDIYLSNSTGIMIFRNTTFVEVNVTQLSKSYEALYMYDGNDTVTISIDTEYDSSWPSFEGYSYVLDEAKFWGEMFYSVLVIVGLIAGNLLHTVISREEKEDN